MDEVVIKITGFVQGVSFRYYAKQLADSLGIKGWVRNKGDRTLEIVAQGEAKVLEKYIGWCHKGPPLAEVKDVSYLYRKPTQTYSDFSILPMAG